MDANLQKEVENAVRKVYEDVKENRGIPDMSRSSAEGAAEVVLLRLRDNLSKGTGLKDDPDNVLLTKHNMEDVPKRVALLYIEELLLEHKENDPSRRPIWEKRR
jgi:hypothetical protein